MFLERDKNNPRGIKYFERHTLQKMIFLIKGKTDVLLQVATYNRNVMNLIKSRKKFDSESKRIAVELRMKKH